jgi:hypothetical protein
MAKLSKLQLKKLAEAQHKAILLDTLQKNKKGQRSPAQVLEAIFQRQVSYHLFTQDSGYEELSLIVQQHSNKADTALLDKFHKFLGILTKKGLAEMLSDPQIVKALWSVIRYRTAWLAEIEDFKPASKNPYRVFAQMVRYLFAHYEMPVFMDNAFYAQNDTHIHWYIHLGKGGNLRKAHRLPFELTTKMSHYVLKAPYDFTIEEALRYGQIIGMGGDMRLVRHILATKLGRGFEHEDFWETVIRFFVQNPMLDPIQIQPIVDFLQNVKYETRRVVRGRGQVEILPPQHPDFSLKGRTVASVLRLVQEWHRELNRLPKVAFEEYWNGFAIPDFVHEAGNEWTGKVYKIRQLLTADELRKEGNAQSHCVSSYNWSCAKGDASIWSLTIEDTFSSNPKRLVTIELNKSRYIVQIRGKYNRQPTAEELDIVERWALCHALRFSKYVRD